MIAAVLNWFLHAVVAGLVARSAQPGWAEILGISAVLSSKRYLISYYNDLSMWGL